MVTNIDIKNAMQIRLNDELPEYPDLLEGVRRAPRREANLRKEEKALALRNALRYIPEQHHKL
ncbi:MAG: hypothetical protein GX829_04515, partial [Clostridium sp.]|nr:hypothetical protein [Clostridium sp.]